MDNKLSVKSSGLGPDGVQFGSDQEWKCTARAKKSSIENNWDPNQFLVQKQIWSLVFLCSFMPISREHLQVFFGCNKQRECEGDVLFPTGFTQRTLPFNLFCFLLCFQASPLPLFFQVSSWFIAHLFQHLQEFTFWAQGDIATGSQGSTGISRPKGFLQLAEFFLVKVSQKLFQVLAHDWFFSLQRLARCEHFLGCIVWDSRLGTFRHCHETSTLEDLV